MSLWNDSIELLTHLLYKRSPAGRPLGGDPGHSDRCSAGESFTLLTKTYLTLFIQLFSLFCSELCFISTDAYLLCKKFSNI